MVESIRGKHASIRSPPPLLVASDAGGATCVGAGIQNTISSAAGAARRPVEALQRCVSGRPRERLPLLQDISDPAATQSAAVVFDDHAQQVQVGGLEDVRARIRGERFDFLLVEVHFEAKTESTVVVRDGAEMPAIFISAGDLPRGLEDKVETALIRDHTANQALLESVQPLAQCPGRHCQAG